MAAPWSDERVEKLKALWMTHSANEIMRALNDMAGTKLSRNAVIGKGLRLYLPAKRGVKPAPLPAMVERRASPPRRYTPVQAVKPAPAPKVAKSLTGGGVADAAPPAPRAKTGFDFALSTVEQKQTWQEVGQGAIARLETEADAGLIMADMEVGQCWRILGRREGQDLYCGQRTDIVRGRRASFCPGCHNVMFVPGKPFNPKGLRKQAGAGYAR